MSYLAAHDDSCCKPHFHPKDQLFIVNKLFFADVVSVPEQVISLDETLPENLETIEIGETRMFYPSFYYKC
jgi:hypothetical protein